MKVGKYTIKWRYHRAATQDKLIYRPAIEDKREYTTCIIECEACRATGTATCHPSDNFCKDTGRRISLANAMKYLPLSKEEKREIWEAYRNMTVKKRW